MKDALVIISVHAHSERQIQGYGGTVGVTGLLMQTLLSLG